MILWSVAVITFAQHSAEVETVPLPSVATNALAYSERPIRTCGRFRGGQMPTLFYYGGPEWYDGYLLRVSLNSERLASVPSNICVTGILRRSDGLTETEARARGLGTSRGSHGLRFPGHVFYVTHVEEWRDPPSTMRAERHAD